MRPTHVLESVNSNMSQLAAADWTNVPDAENTLPAHSQRKWGYLKGSTAELIRGEYAGALRQALRGGALG